MTGSRALRGLIPYLKPYWRWVVIAPLLMLLEVAMDLMQPRLLQRIVDEGITQMNMALVIQTGLWMAGLAAVGVFGGVGNGVFTSKAAQSFAADVREALFAKVQALSFRKLDQFETGQLVTRLTNDVTQIQEAVSTLLRILIRAPLLMVGSLVMALVTAPELAWLLLGLLPLLLLIVIWIVGRATPLYGAVQRHLDVLNEVLQENLAGVRVVKAFVRAQHERARFGRGNRELTDQGVRAARLVAVTQPVMMMALNAGIVGVLWFGGIRVVAGTMQVGQILAFVSYMQQTLFSLVMVSMLVIQVARAAASAQRIDEVLQSESDIRDRPTAIRDVDLHGRVTFEGVHFWYDGEGADPVLQDVSLTVEPGQTVALLGATGTGKSTLVNLIPRFYDATAGRVAVDGIDVRDLDSQVLRRSIGIALQETVLFSGTIRDNIRYGRPDAGDDEVVAAAQAAQAHGFVMAFPAGYDTVVGQRGVNLSGGQKQRIAIARALLVDPAILILDDSTSSVDVETEALIQSAIREKREGSTCVLIAQRVSSVLNADQILVQDGGRIVAAGTHAELLASSPVYREIYDSQLGGGAMADG